jgi:hypothetical protein
MLTYSFGNIFYVLASLCFTPKCLWLEVLDINLPLNEQFKLLGISIFEHIIASVECLGKKPGWYS